MLPHSSGLWKLALLQLYCRAPLTVAKLKVFGLQVKEALMTSALLKLPQSTPFAKKEERVEQILSELVRLHFARAEPELRCYSAENAEAPEPQELSQAHVRLDVR